MRDQTVNSVFECKLIVVEHIRDITHEQHLF